MNVHKVERIAKKQSHMFCYVSIPVKLLSTYRPFDSALLKNPANGLYAPVILEITNRLDSGLEVSEDLSRYLHLKQNDNVELDKVYNIAPGSSVDLMIKKLGDEDGSNEDQPVDTQNLIRRVKQMFRYCYIVDGYTFVKNKTQYTFKINDVNKRYCHLVPYTVFHYRSSGAVENYSALGVDEAYNVLKQLVQWPLVYPTYYKKLKIETPKGILLYGPSGCGKTHLIRQLAKTTNLKTYTIKGPEILSKYFGGSQQALRNTFEEAKKNQPSIILIDQIDSISKKRGEIGQTQARLVSQLLSCMDGLEDRGNVIVVATTNFPNSIDTALRRPGRFDKQIEIKPPNVGARKQLLKVFLKGLDLKQIDLDTLAERTHGFVSADLKLFCNEAKINVLRRAFENREREFTIREQFYQKLRQDPEQVATAPLAVKPPEETFTLKILPQDFEYALKKVKPSSLRQYNVSQSNVKLADVVGYDKVKERLIREITYPIKYHQVYKKYNIKKIKGIVLEGPPGTGKTTLAKALSSEVSHNFMYLSPAQILSKYVGQTESKIRQVFQRARNSEPCVVFIDELDGLFGNSRQVGTQSHQISKSTQFLSLMDGISTEDDNIFFIGTTNRLDLVDPAFVRAGRFELILKMDYPDKKQLAQLYKYYFKDCLDPSEDLSSLVSYSHKVKLTGSDMVAIKRIALSDVISKSNIEEIKHLEEKPAQKLLTADSLKRAIEVYLKYKYKERPLEVADGY